MNLGPLEIIFIFVFALIVLGPQRLPEAARQIGKFMRDIRTWSEDIRGEITDALDVESMMNQSESSKSADASGALAPAKDWFDHQAEEEAAKAAALSSPTDATDATEPDRAQPAEEASAIETGLTNDTGLPAARVSGRAAPIDTTDAPGEPDSGDDADLAPRSPWLGTETPAWEPRDDFSEASSDGPYQGGPPRR